MPITQPIPKVQPLPKVDLLGCQVSYGSYPEVLRNIIDLAASGQSSYVCFANVHMLYEANHNEDFRQVVNQANLVCPDGRPLSVLMRLRYGIKQERTCGMDLFPDILRETARRGLSVFFYGSTEELLNQVCDKALETYPTLTIAGAYSPPFRPLTVEEDAEVVDMINHSGADLVFVSLGCPKQEQWMQQHQSKINACMLGLGQAFRTFAGIEKRLPTWARNLSLEWLYRLWLEPRRLAKRYLVGNSWFLLKSLKDLLS
ncbi:MAG: WecB/TagA/CpsF family glycosyltransferase [Bacteroidota bacterium]